MNDYSFENRIFEAQKCNWGCKSMFDWDSVKWILYSDRTLKRTVSYGIGDDCQTKTVLSEEKYQEILSLINIKNMGALNEKIDACDGVAWSMTAYKDNDILWSRNMSYIYGIEELQKIANFLANTDGRYPLTNSPFH